MTSTDPLSKEPMHPQLTTLMEIQDLRMQKKELEASTDSAELESKAFNVQVADAVERLEEKIEELEGELEGSTRRRYQTAKGTLDRVVVPVIDGVCYGCFVSIPTATVADRDPNDTVQICQQCGRFIYILS